MATARIATRFRGQPHRWDRANTCLHLLRAQLRAMGHKPPAIPAFRSAMGARQAMLRAGFADVATVVDSVLPLRIAPAEMVIGDVGVLPGEGGMDAVVICAGGAMLGWHARADGFAAMTVPLSDFIAAWRT